jgi:hypothetical protein
MTFEQQLREIAARAIHSTETGREVAALANAIADQVALNAPALDAAGPEAAQNPDA